MAWTYAEFTDINDWWDFRNFCEEYGVYPDDVNLDNLRSPDEVAEVVKDLAYSCRWDDITDYLRDLGWNGDNGETFEESDNEYYLRELTYDDLEECKGDVLQQLHDNGDYLDGEEREECDDDVGTEGSGDSGDIILPRYNNKLYGTVVADAEYRNGDFGVNIDSPETDLMGLLSC